MTILRIEIRSKANAPEMWVVYDNPTDYPGRYVLRRFVASEDKSTLCPTNEFYVSRSAELLQQHLPEGLMRLPPDPDDDPKIMEVWI